MRYTDDVKESLLFARKLAQKMNRGVLADRYLLHGLILTRRTFNRVDVLLKELQASPGEIKKRLDNNAIPSDHVHQPENAGEAKTPVLESAETFARQTGEIVHQPPAMEVEHVLKALCFSDDPLVTHILKDHNITPDRVDQAVIQLNAKRGQHSALFVIKELAEVIAFVLFFLILIKSFVGELRLIPSESMVPLLRIEDRLVIERVSRWNRPYQRGDVLVFYPPMTELKQDPLSVFLRLTGFSGLMYRKEENIDVAYIKRLIGLPGDTVDVRPYEGVYINDKKLEEPYTKEIADTCTLMQSNKTSCADIVSNLRASAQACMTTHPAKMKCDELVSAAEDMEHTCRSGDYRVVHCGPMQIPPGKYFMMGDNRRESLDSRYWGFADQERVIGRAVYRVWPLQRIGSLPPPPYQKEK